MSDENKKTFADNAESLFDKGFFGLFVLAICAGLLGGFYELLVPMLSADVQIFVKSCIAGSMICMCLSVIVSMAKRTKR